MVNYNKVRILKDIFDFDDEYNHLPKNLALVGDILTVKMQRGTFLVVAHDDDPPNTGFLIHENEYEFVE